MKQFILSIIICLCTLISVQAETIQEGNVFKVEQSSEVKETMIPYFYEINDVKYPIYVSANGSFYIKRISKKTGQEYKYYLPKEVQEKLKKLL